MLSRRSILAVLCVLAGLVVPGIARATVAAGPEGSVRACERMVRAQVEGAHPASRARCQGWAPTCDRLASGSLPAVVYAADRAPQTVPRLVFADQPLGAGQGRYWFVPVDGTTLEEGPPGPAVLVDAAAATRNASSAGGLASRTLSHVHVDHLGSTRLRTDEQGAMLEEVKFTPFGVELGGPGAGRMKFTGHERDEVLGLDYMLARYCGASQARFVGVDPVTGIARAPQSWNRYAYVQNSPLVYRDPDGEWLETAFDLAMAAVSIKQAWDDPSVGNIAGAALDIAAVVLPVVPAVGGRALDAVQAGSKLAAAARTARKVDDATDTARAVRNAARGGDDAVDAFRAVSRAEADDIARHGFRPDPSGRGFQEGKWFSETREGAETFQNRFADLDEVVHTRVPRPVYDRSLQHPNIDGTGPGFCVQCADLPLLPRP